MRHLAVQGDSLFAQKHQTMIPYISELKVYANGYSSATIKSDEGEFKTNNTPTLLVDTHQDWGIQVQNDMVMAIATKMLNAFLVAYNAEKLASAE